MIKILKEITDRINKMSHLTLANSKLPEIIDDIKLVRELGRGAQCIVYLGERGTEKLAVKVLSQEALQKDKDAIHRFYCEAGILARCKHPNLAKILKVSKREETSPYIIMEFLEGRVLSAVIESKRMNDFEVLDLAIQVASALGEFHRFGMVHRDLKPKNIVMSEMGQAKVIDFGLATREKRTENSEVVGTFLYSSPEQMGLLDRPLDQRADLYSLGIILFECLTQSPPYRSENQGELMHMHLSSPIPNVRKFNPSASILLSAVISRLMAKDPDDRYHSAPALLNELYQLKTLGENIHDSSVQILSKVEFEIQDKDSLPMVGRETEVESLKLRMRQARSGQGQIVLLSGESGTGKSRLAREIIAESRKMGPLVVLSAKASVNHALPLGPIREMTNDFFRNLTNENNEIQKQFENRIKNTFSDRVDLISKITPNLERVFDGVVGNSVNILDQEKFYETCVDLLLNLRSKDEQIIYFIDDVQWIDDSSFQILKRLTSRLIDFPHVLIMSAREEISGTNEIFEMLTEHGGDRFENVHLTSLDLFSTRKLISLCLGDAEVDETLLKNVYTRSNGNAFAVQQFISAMIEGGVLIPNWGKWELSLEGLENIRLPTDVIQLLLQRTKGLGLESIKVLKYASVLSDVFDASVLSQMSKLKQEQVDNALFDAFEMKLVEAMPNHKIRFVHDKIREAFESLLISEEHAQTHQMIGDYLFEQKSGNPVDVYATANHYRLGIPSQNPKRTFEATLKAAIIASENIADHEALTYFQVADGVASLESQLRNANFEEAYGICLIRAGRALEAEKHLLLGIQLSKTTLQRARIYSRLLQVAEARGNRIEAWKFANLGFLELGVSPIVKGPLIYLQSLSAFLVSEFVDRFIGILKPPVDQARIEKLKVLLDLSTRSSQLAFFDLRKDLMFLAGMRSMFWARQLGPSKELSVAYSHTATLAALFSRRKRNIVYENKSIEIARAIHDPITTAYIKINNAVNWMFLGDDELDIERRYRIALEYAFKWGDSSHYLNGTNGLLQRIMRRGVVKEAFELMRLALLKNSSPEFNMQMMSYRLAVLAFSGRLREASLLHKELEQFKRTSGSSFNALHTLNEGIYLLEQNELGSKADNFLEEYSRSGLRSKGSPDYARAVHVPALHIRLNQWISAPEAEKSKRFNQLKDALSDIRKYGGVGIARKEPEDLIQAHIYYSEATIKRILGEINEAHRLLDIAQALAIKSDCPWVLYEVFRQRALIFKSLGYISSAKQHFGLALNVAQIQGWEARGARVKKEHDQEGLPTGGIQYSKVSVSTQKPSEDGLAFLLQKQLEALLTIGVESSKVAGLEPKCRVVLKQLILLLNPERAFLFLYDRVSGETLLQIGQDSSAQDISQISNYSASIVETVRTNREAVVVTGSEDSGTLSTESIISNELRSILAAPLLLDGELIGIIYLDSRVAKGIFRERDVQLLIAFGNHIAASIETTRAGELELKKNSLVKDLEVAGAVQTLLLPQSNQVNYSGLEAQSFFQTADQAGGDWWCIDQLENGKLRILLGDVTGHGAGSAMLTAVVASCYQTIKELLKGIEIPMVVDILNKTLTQFCRGEYWMTFSAVEIDPKLKTFEWWNMGSPPILKSKSKKMDMIVARESMPLGSGELKISRQTGSFEPGDSLMVFSDGLYEFRSVTNKEFGLKRLMKLAHEAQTTMDLSQRVNFISSSINEFRGTPRPPDDITFTLVQYKSN